MLLLQFLLILMKVKENYKRSRRNWGLNVVRIINELTAAELAYIFNNQIEDVKSILVFDLGGRTFDVPILKLEKSKFKVLSKEIHI